MEVNSPYIKGHNSKTPNKYIMYLDANNMYGWAMSQCLPTGGFKWLTPNQINELDLHSLNPDAGKGLILEVDLEYSHELQDLQNGYPLAAEKMRVTKNMLSPYCRKEQYYKIHQQTIVKYRFVTLGQTTWNKIFQRYL